MATESLGPRVRLRAAVGRLPGSVGQTQRSVVVGVVAAVLLAIGAVLAASLIVELSGDPSAGIHHDFLAFYAAAKLVLDGRPDRLYDPAAMTVIQRTIIPVPVGANGYMPFINPPFAAAALAPLAALPPQVARVVWAAVSLVVVVAAAAWIGRDLPRGRRLLAVLLVAGSFPAYHALAEGQLSFVLLGAGLVAIAAARDRRWVLAGTALAVFWLKPQFILLPLVALVMARRWRAIAALVVIPAGAIALLLPVTGIGAYAEYASYLAGVTASHYQGAGAVGPATWQGDLASMESLNGLFADVLGQGAVTAINALWVVSAVLVVAALAYAARVRGIGFATAGQRVVVAAFIAATLLINPNLFVQDCVLVFWLVEVLRPVPGERQLEAIVATAGLAALVFVDQFVGPIHLFTVALLAIVAAACLPPSLLARLASPAAPAGSLPSGRAARSE